MHRPDAAARRFYRLFYQWTVLTCPPLTRQLTSQTRALHTTDSTSLRIIAQPSRNTARRSVQDTNFPPGGKRNDGVARSGQGARRRQKERSSTQAKQFGKGRIQALYAGSAQSPAEMPFSALQPGDRILRYKSETSVMVELAFYGNHIHVLQRNAGPRLEKLNGSNKARVDLQSLTRLLDVSKANKPENVLHSILVTGTRDQVTTAVHAISDACGYTKDVRDNLPRSIFFGPVASAIVRPTSSLADKEYVVRFRSETTTVMEMAVHQEEANYENFMKRAEYVGSKNNCTVEGQRVEGASSSSITSLLISGSLSAVGRVTNALITLLHRSKLTPDGTPHREKDSKLLLPLESQQHSTLTRTSLELSLTERQWMRLVSTFDVQSIAEKNGAQVNAGEPEQRPRDSQSSETEVARSVYINGTAAAIEATHKAILSAVKGQAARSDSSMPSTADHDAKTPEQLTSHEISPTRTPTQDSHVGSSETTSSPAHGKTIGQSTSLSSAIVKGPTQASLSASSEAPPKPTQKESPPVSERLREAMQKLIHPVVVITSSNKQPGMSWLERIKSARGVTVSSFNTVTLQPTPIVSFNLKVPSRSWDAIQSAQRMRIHILAASEEGASIAHLFTRLYTDPAEPFQELAQRRIIRGSSDHGVRIRPHDGTVLFNMAARLLPDKCIQVGDHVIVVAEVYDCWPDKALGGRTWVAESSASSALAYSGRAYRNGSLDIVPGDLPDKRLFADESPVRQSVRRPGAAGQLESAVQLDSAQHPGPMPQTPPAPEAAQLQKTVDQTNNEPAVVGPPVPEKYSPFPGASSSSAAQESRDDDEHAGQLDSARQPGPMPQSPPAPEAAQLQKTMDQPNNEPAVVGPPVPEQYSPFPGESSSSAAHKSRDDDERAAVEEDGDEKFGSGPRDDVIYEAMRAMRNADRSGEDVDALQIMSDLDKAMGLDDVRDNEQYGYGDRDGLRDEPESGVEREEYNLKDAEESRGVRLDRKTSSAEDMHGRLQKTGPFWSAEDLAREDSARVAERETGHESVPPAAQETGETAVSGDKTNSPEILEPANTSGQHAQSERAGGGAQAPLWGPEDVSREDSARLAEKERPGVPEDVSSKPEANESSSSSSASSGSSASSSGAWGLPSIFKRSFATASLPHRRCLGQARFYSSSSQSTTSSSTPDASLLLDPAARHTTVADFLGLPDGDQRLPTHRLRSVVKMNEEAKDAKRRLEEEVEYLTEAEKLVLEHTITTNDRIVSKKLAWNAAGDLRIMLDKGRVDFKRAQFMETTIEKGQAVLLEEAKQVRKLLNEGKIDGERFRKAKEHLERMNNVLLTETNRLRQFVDEDGDGEMYYHGKGD